MDRPFRFAGDLFAQLHQELVGTTIAFETFDRSAIPQTRLVLAQNTWVRRAQAEFRSIQILSRFLSEVVGAGDPVDVYAGVVAAISDEIRQCALSLGVCQSLGVDAILPKPVPLDERHATSEAPMAERALYTAITMLGINETISAGFVADLHARCNNPIIKAVLDATVSREPRRTAFRWRYIAMSLERFPPEAMTQWRKVARAALTSQISSMQPMIESIPEEDRNLEAWPDDDRVDLGLFSQQRQALIFQDVVYDVLRPQLEQLNLL